MDDDIEDLQTGFAQVPTGDERDYCRHGVYVGNPYGADLLCPWCESGQEPNPKRASARLQSPDLVTWQSSVKGKIDSKGSSDQAHWHEALTFLEGREAEGYELDEQTRVVMIALRAALGLEQKEWRA